MEGRSDRLSEIRTQTKFHIFEHKKLRVQSAKWVEFFPIGTRHSSRIAVGHFSKSIKAVGCGTPPLVNNVNKPSI